MLKSKALILAKIETAYGTDAAPVVGTDAVLVIDAPRVEQVIKSITRDNVRTFLGARPRLNIGEGIKISFSTELKGSGTAGTAPEIGKLFRACGMTETISAGISVTYAPNSKGPGSSPATAFESLTIWYYVDGLCHKVTGCRGTWKLDMTVNEYAKIDWDFTGIYAAPVDLALATGSFNATVPPKCVSALFAIDSYAAIVEKILIDMGNTIAQRKSINAATGILEWYIQSRNVTGEIDPEAVTIATKDFWTALGSSTQVAFTAKVAGAAGNILTISAPKVQIADIKYGDREGILTNPMPLVFTPSSGNDEISLVFT